MTTLTAQMDESEETITQPVLISLKSCPVLPDLVTITISYVQNSHISIQTEHYFNITCIKGRFIGGRTMQSLTSLYLPLLATNVYYTSNPVLELVLLITSLLEFIKI